MGELNLADDTGGVLYGNLDGLRRRTHHWPQSLGDGLTSHAEYRRRAEQALRTEARPTDLAGWYALRQAYRALLYTQRPDDLITSRLPLVAGHLLKIFPNSRIDLVSKPLDWALHVSTVRLLSHLQVLGHEEVSEIYTPEQSSTLGSGPALALVGERLFAPLMLLAPEGFLLGWDFTMLDHYILCFFGEPHEVPTLEASSLFVRGGLINEWMTGPEDLSTVGPPLQLEHYRLASSWYVAQLNELLVNALLLTNFRMSDSSELVPRIQYQFLLTLERIFGLTARMMATNDPWLRKQLALLLLDMHARIRASQIDDLLGANYYSRNVVSPLRHQRGPEAPFAQAWAEWAAREWSGLVEEVVSGIYSKRRRREDGVQVGSPGDYQTISKDRYFGRFLRALRNTVHGYVSSEFDDILYFHDLEVPENVPLLAVAYFLATMADPARIFRRFQNWRT